MAESLPYDPQRTGLKEDIYQILDRTIQPTLRLVDSVLRDKGKWPRLDILRGINDLSVLQDAMDDEGMRDNNDHYKIIEYIAITRHLALSMYGPILFKSSSAFSKVENQQVEWHEKEITLGQEIGEIIADLRPEVEYFSGLLKEKAESYGWRNRSDKPYGHIAMADRVQRTSPKPSVPVTLKPDRVSIDDYVQAARSMHHLTKKANTAISIYMSDFTLGDPTQRTSLNALVLDHIDNEGKMHYRPASLIDLHDRIEKNLNLLDLRSMMQGAIEKYDNYILRSNWENEWTKEYRVLIDTVEVQLGVLRELHHLYMRHVRRKTYPETRRILIDRLYEKSKQEKLKRAILLISTTTAFLMDNIEMIGDDMVAQSLNTMEGMSYTI